MYAEPQKQKKNKNWEDSPQGIEILEQKQEMKVRSGKLYESNIAQNNIRQVVDDKIE